MLNLARPGVYVLSARAANTYAQQLVEQWIKSQGSSPYKACLWLTPRTEREVFNILHPHLQHPQAHLKGLDVVCTRPLLTQGKGPDGIRQLCRSLNSLTVLHPTLVVLEHPELWFGQGNEPREHATHLAEMSLLQRWAKYAQAHLVLPCDQQLPPWSVFANGLANLTAAGHIEFSPWWPKEQGMVSQLWNTSTSIQQGVLLHAQQFDSLKALAIRIHALRNTHPSHFDIQVRATQHLSDIDCAALLRLGADAIHFAHPNIQPPPSTSTPNHKPLIRFAQDLHEAFMPGQLTVHSNIDFSTHCTMMTALGSHWGMHSSLTRLSLLPHVTPEAALRLINFGQAAGLFTASTEAVYAFKWWSEQPTDEAILEWLAQSLHDQLSSAFVGDIHVLEPSAQIAMLHTLHNAPTSLPIDTIRANSFDQHTRMAELWKQFSPQAPKPRPWLNRLHTWLLQEGNEHV